MTANKKFLGNQLSTNFISFGPSFTPLSETTSIPSLPLPRAKSAERINLIDRRLAQSVDWNMKSQNAHYRVRIEKLIQWNPNFSNRQFPEDPDNWNRVLSLGFASLRRTLSFYHRFLKPQISRSNRLANQYSSEVFKSY